MTPIEFARHYAARYGFAVFPVHWITPAGGCSCRRAGCRSAGKHPVTPDGFRSASARDMAVTAFWRKYPHANIGIATGPISAGGSGIVVLDVDPRHGGDRSLTAFDLPATMKCRTGGGGEHYYFRLPAGVTVRNSAGKLGPGLDVRGEGGYVVAPPSNHASGGKYEWENEGEMAELPNALCSAGVSPAVAEASRLRPENVSAGRTHDSRRDGGATPMPRGTRNSSLASLAGTMRRRGMSRAAIEQALLAENRERCAPPLDDAEVRGIARSVARYAVGSDSLDSKNSPDSTDPLDLTDPLDPAGCLQIWNLNEFLRKEFRVKELICFEAGRGDVVMLAARTNAGKSTLLRNCLLRLATGRAFGSLVPAGRPRRVLLLDFESDDADLQQDLATMTAGFSAVDHDLLTENFMVAPKGMIGTEMFQLNLHLNFVQNFILSNAIEVLIINNISAAFELADENSNAEMNRRVVKPLQKLAFHTGAQIVFAHHIGKASEGRGDEVYAGRGASTLPCMAKVVFNMKGRVDIGEQVTVSCAKRKRGQNYDDTFRLDTAARWFVETAAQAPVTKPRSQNYDAIVDWIRKNATAEKPVKTGEIVAAFPGMGRASVMKQLRDGVETGDLANPNRSLYFAPGPSK